ncbi:hypothetical protein ACS5PU_16985 [Pedobacter sp. GSP4]|uniref:hypothetical protein n=1 Tax=Pedobacter sp. GSP4 TaxID=3453716 RepID=UPI003EEA3548
MEESKSTATPIPREIHNQDISFEIGFNSKVNRGYCYCIHDGCKHIDKNLIYKIYRLTINNVTPMLQAMTFANF